MQNKHKYGNIIYNDNIVVRHINNNSLDNSWNNIIVGTYKDNSNDIPQDVRMKRSINATQYCKKYSDEKVLEIIRFYKSSNSYKETMKKFNISSKGTLNFILNYRLVSFQ